MANKCGKCGFLNNPDDAHYCGKCGVAFDQDLKMYDETEYKIHSRSTKCGIFSLVVGLCAWVYVVFSLIYPKLIDTNIQKWSSTWSLIWNLIMMVIVGGIGIYCIIIGFKSFSKSK